MLHWIIVGLIAGVLAKAVVPGGDREPKGCLMTMLLGIAGAMVMGTILRTLGSGENVGLIGATFGAIILILVFRKFWK